MKTFLISAVILAALCAIYANRSMGAPLDLDIKTSNDLDKVILNKKAKDKIILQDKSPLVLDLLDFQSASIVQTFRPSLRATLISKSIKPINATYTLFKWNGSKWTQIRNGSVTIPAKQTATITERLAPIPGLQHFRLDVSDPSNKIALSKRLKFTGRERPKKQFVLTLKTNGWVAVHVQVQKGSNELIGTQARNVASECQAEGFRTQLKIKHDYAIIGDDTYTTTAYATLDAPIEKVFDTAQERDDYRRRILKLVPSFTNDGTGLSATPSER